MMKEKKTKKKGVKLFFRSAEQRFDFFLSWLG